jgi:mRNA-degrading endonuclease toxin of MazEF toxin-antitoxin module
VSRRSWPSTPRSSNSRRPSKRPTYRVALRLEAASGAAVAGRPPTGRQNVVAQVTSIKHNRRQRAAWYQCLLADQDPYPYRITEQRQVVTTESAVNLTNLSTVNRDTLPRWTGKLSDAEMRVISEKLIDTLELDISGRLAAPRGAS